MVGTKSEMERLLKDAQKISGVKYDISNLNDVYSAIHVVQTELGITGTTAKEASTTIQGSIGSMKSAYANFLTGLADDNADLTELSLNLVYSAETAIQNIIPTIQRMISGISEALPQVIAEIGANIPEFLEAGIDIAKQLIQGIRNCLFNNENGMGLIAISNSIIETLIKGIIDLLPDIIQTGIDIILGLVNGLSESLPELIPVVIDAIITIVENLIDNIDMIIDAGIQLILGLVDGIIVALPKLIEKAPEIISKIYEALVRNFPEIVKAGGELIGKMVAGVVGSLFKLGETAPQIISSIVNGLNSLWEEMKKAGKYLIEGLWNGITGMGQWLKDKVTGFAKNIVGNIKEALGIHSPSTIFRDEVGKFMAQGIGIGFSDEMGNVAKDMKNAVPTNFDIESSLNYSSNSKVDVLLGLLENYLPQIVNSSNKNIVLDTGVLVGSTVDIYNTNLANIRRREERGG